MPRRSNTLRYAALITPLLFGLLGGSPAHAVSDEIQLPSLGDATSGLISTQQEYELGRDWLISFRRSAPVINDPVLVDYLEHLIYQLATVSELEDRRLQLVVVDAQSMNAFAVPGGVVGVHNGLFLYAQSEDQLSSVLSHELAHISQRHFARGVQKQQQAYIPTLAGMLAGLVLAATGNGSAGMAAISATQAAALQSQLSYSRSNEQEADRIGMKTLANAGMDAAAVAEMFEQMQRAARYYSARPPEFLLTHPVTESRISDARNRAADYPSPEPRVDIEYQLMQARVKLYFQTNPQVAVNIFRDELADPRKPAFAAQYGLALALTKTLQLDEARELLQKLLAQDPNRITYLVALAEVMLEAGETDQAQQMLAQHLRYNPQNHPLTYTMVEVYRRSGKMQQAEALLEQHIKTRSSDPEMWYQLAEIRGLAQNIVGVHEARAEYFVLMGASNQAIKQLTYALQLVPKDDYRVTTRLQQRIQEIQAWQAKRQI